MDDEATARLVGLRVEYAAAKLDVDAAEAAAKQIHEQLHALRNRAMKLYLLVYEAEHGIKGDP